MNCSESLPLYYIGGIWFWVAGVFIWLFGGNGGPEMRVIQKKYCGFFITVASFLYWSGTLNMMCNTTVDMAPDRDWNLARNLVFCVIQLCFVAMLTRRFNTNSHSTILFFAGTILANLALIGSIYFSDESNWLFLTSLSLQAFVYINIWTQHWTLQPNDTSFTKKCYFVSIVYWFAVYIILFVGPWITNHASILFQEITLTVIDCIIATPVLMILVRYSWVEACSSSINLSAGKFSTYTPEEQADLKLAFHSKSFYENT